MTKYTHSRVFRILFSWWIPIGVSVTVSHQGVQNCSHFSGPSLKCYRMDGLYLPFDFHVFWPLLQNFENLPSAPITSGITATFICHCYFRYLASARYFIFFFSNLWSAGRTKVTIRYFLFPSHQFCLLSLGLISWPKLGVCI